MTEYTPPKPYTHVKSPLIKQEIKDREFNNPNDRNHIHKLIKTEGFILDEWGGCGYRRAKKRWKQNHPDLWETIENSLKDIEQPEEQTRINQLHEQIKQLKQEIDEKERKITAIKSKKEAEEQWQLISSN